MHEYQSNSLQPFQTATFVEMIRIMERQNELIEVESIRKNERKREKNGGNDDIMNVLLSIVILRTCKKLYYHLTVQKVQAIDNWALTPV